MNLQKERYFLSQDLSSREYDLEILKNLKEIVPKHFFLHTGCRLFIFSNGHPTF